MTGKVNVKYVSIIIISCQQTKPLGMPKKCVKLFVARTNYKGWNYRLCMVFYQQIVSTYKMIGILIRCTLYGKHV